MELHIKIHKAIKLIILPQTYFRNMSIVSIYNINIFYDKKITVKRPRKEYILEAYNNSVK